MITIALSKRTLSPVRLVLKVTFFCCYMPQWRFFVFWGVLTRLTRREEQPILRWSLVADRSYGYNHMGMGNGISA